TVKLGSAAAGANENRAASTQPAVAADMIGFIANSPVTHPSACRGYAKGISNDQGRPRTGGQGRRPERVPARPRPFAGTLMKTTRNHKPGIARPASGPCSVPGGLSEPPPIRTAADQ